MDSRPAVVRAMANAALDAMQAAAADCTVSELLSATFTTTANLIHVSLQMSTGEDKTYNRNRIDHQLRLLLESIHPAKEMN